MLRSPLPLFDGQILSKALASFGFPKNLQSRGNKLIPWLTLQPSNPISEAEFLHDLFVDVCGYGSPFDNQNWELEFSPHPVLGFFNKNTSYILAEIYIGDIWQKPTAQFATTLWIITSNYQQIRLYKRSEINSFYEEFNLQTAVQNEDELKRLYFLLCRRTLLSANHQEPARLQKLFGDSCHKIEQLINELYQQIFNIRNQLIKNFSHRLSQHYDYLDNNASDLAIAKAYKLLNRIIFILYAESQALLPKHLIINAYEFINPYVEQPIWENYKAIFRWIEQGNQQQSVPKYGGSLFAFDPILDGVLFVGNELCRQIKELNKLDFTQNIAGIAIACTFKEILQDLHLNKPKKLKYTPKLWQPYMAIVNMIAAYLKDHNHQEQLNILEQIIIFDPKCHSGMNLLFAIHGLWHHYQQVYAHLELTVPPQLLTTILATQIQAGDRNPIAVEITQLSLWCLWLQTLSHPLPNLDSAIAQSQELLQPSQYPVSLEQLR